MRLSTASAALVALSAAACASAPSTHDAPAAAPIVIYDGRVANGPTAPVSARDGALDRTVLTAVDPAFLTDREQCGDAGGRVLSVAGTASGAFTAAGRDQRLYLVTEVPCDAESLADEANAWSHLVVVEGGAVVANVKAWGTAIARVADIDGDGVAEIATTAGGTGQGFTVENLQIASVAGGRAAVVRPVDEVYTDGCGTLEDKRDVEVVLLTVIPASPPRFTTTRFRASCDGMSGPADFEPVAE